MIRKEVVSPVFFFSFKNDKSNLINNLNLIGNLEEKYKS